MTTKDKRLDAINRRILDHMQIHGRDTYSSIASDLDLSVNTVRDRIIAMERRGVIRGYGPVLDLEKRGFPTRLMAFLHANSDTQECNEEVITHPYIQAAYLSPSRYRLILDLAGPDIQTLRDFVVEAVQPCGYHSVNFEILETLQPVAAEPATEEATVTFATTGMLDRMGPSPAPFVDQ